jgi:hypothetical protein
MVTAVNGTTCMQVALIKEQHVRSLATCTSGYEVFMVFWSLVCKAGQELCLCGLALQSTENGVMLCRCSDSLLMQQ